MKSGCLGHMLAGQPPSITASADNIESTLRHKIAWSHAALCDLSACRRADVNTLQTSESDITHADGTPTRIDAVTPESRLHVPKLPISDPLYVDSSAKEVHKWRERRCSPDSPDFHPRARLSHTPRLQHRAPPEQFAVLEVHVVPDAQTTVHRVQPAESGAHASSQEAGRPQTWV